MSMKFKRRKAKGKRESIQDPSVKTTKRLAEWAAAASEVEPEDIELSAMWRSILDSILDSEDESEQLLRVVKALPGSDIRIFLNQCDSPTSVMQAFRKIFAPVSDAALDRLRAQGLIRRVVGYPFMTAAAAMGGLFWFYFNAWVGKLEEFLSPPFLLAMVATFAFILAPILRLHNATALGRRLHRLYKEYLNEKVSG